MHHLADVLRERNILSEARSFAEEAIAVYDRHPDWPSEERHHAFDVLQSVLRVLGAGPNHGYGITARLHQLSDDVLRVEEGSLYPALYRMEEQGLIEAEWRPTSNNRNAKFYALTRKGRRAAQAELDGWLRLSGAVARVLRALEQEA